MNPFKRGIPRDLTPEQLQVILQDEKQELWILYVAAISIGYAAAGYWPSFAPVFGTYGGLMLAGLGAVLGVNVAHKVLNNRVITAGGGGDEEDTSGAGEAKPDAKK